MFENAPDGPVYREPHPALGDRPGRSPSPPRQQTWGAGAEQQRRPSEGGTGETAQATPPGKSWAEIFEESVRLRAAQEKRDPAQATGAGASTAERVGQRSEQGASAAAAASVQVQDTVVGQGRAAVAGDTVSIHYTAKVLDGPTFEKTSPPRPFTFELGGDAAIRGLSFGVAGMKVGGTRKITIPAALAFDSRPHPDVPRGSAVVYVVSLAAISGVDRAAETGEESGQREGRDGAAQAPITWDTSYSHAAMNGFFREQQLICLVGAEREARRLPLHGTVWQRLAKRAILVWVDPEAPSTAPPDANDWNRFDARGVMKMLGVQGQLPQVLVLEPSKNSDLPDSVLCRVGGETPPGEWGAKIEACLPRAK